MNSSVSFGSIANRMIFCTSRTVRWVKKERSAFRMRYGIFFLSSRSISGIAHSLSLYRTAVSVTEASALPLCSSDPLMPAIPVVHSCAAFIRYTYCAFLDFREISRISAPASLAALICFSCRSVFF